MKDRLKLILAGLLLFATTAPASAAVSDWAYSEGGRMRLAALSDSTGGKITAILEIEPQPGWKTYWRDPGDAGMPPQIDLSGAENLALVKVDYPVPEIGQDEGGRFFGYHQPARIVLELAKVDPAKASKLSAHVLVGLCQNICLPFQSSFSLPLIDADRPEQDEFMKIQLARAQLPEAPSDGFEEMQSGLTADRSHFEIAVATPGADVPEIAIAQSEGLLLGRQTDMLTNGEQTIVRYPVRRLPAKSDSARVTLLVKSAGRAMETTLAVK
jgi:DsbC/DsbD-like thiol-disulfide interchange protein